MDPSTTASLLEIAESARARMRGHDRAAAIDDLEPRYPDLMAALDRWLADGRIADADRLATALVPFWMATQRIDDGDAWFARALPEVDDPERARAVYDHGYLVFWAGRYDLASERFEHARALAAGRDPTIVALALAGSARVALDADPREAVRLLREGLDATEGTDDVEGRSSVTHVLGVALQMSGDLAGARDVMAERLTLARVKGDDFIVWVESSNLSMVERRLGNVDRAVALANDALRMISTGSDEMAIAWTINGLAAATAAQGAHQRAATLLGLAEAMLERAGGEWPPDERQQHDETTALLGDALGPVALEAARATGGAMSTPEGLAFALP